MWINPKILEQIKKNCAQLLQSLLILTKIEEFIKLAQQKLKPESLFAIGNHDSVLFNIKECMEEHGFKEVFKNLFKRV